MGDALWHCYTNDLCEKKSGDFAGKSALENIGRIYDITYMQDKKKC